jgi:hypothetical protein
LNVLRGTLTAKLGEIGTVLKRPWRGIPAISRLKPVV